MKYLFFFICPLFCGSVSAQDKKPGIVTIIIGDSTKGTPTTSSVTLHKTESGDLAEQVWYVKLKGKQEINFVWKHKDDSKLDLAGSVVARSVNITLDNDSLVVLYLSHPPRIDQKAYMWVRSNVSDDQVKEFTGHKMVAVTLVADDNLQYPLFSFNEAQQSAIEIVSKQFLLAIK